MSQSYNATRRMEDPRYARLLRRAVKAAIASGRGYLPSPGELIEAVERMSAARLDWLKERVAAPMDATRRKDPRTDVCRPVGLAWAANRRPECKAEADCWLGMRASMGPSPEWLRDNPFR